MDEWNSISREMSRTQAAGSKEQRQTGVDILHVFWDASIPLSWIGSGVHFLCFLSPKPFGHTTDLVPAFLCVCMCGSWWRWGCVTYTWTAQYTLTLEGLKREK